VIDKERVQRAVSELLAAIGEDPTRDGLLETPRRVADMYAELFDGFDSDPGEHLRVTFEAGHEEMVMVRDIPFTSLCEHHLVPFVGLAHVAYLPSQDGRITGLSKMARLVEGYARRLQVQERMTSQIVEAMERELTPRGSIVVIEAEHFCLSMRGVKKAGSTTVTSAVRGLFRTDATSPGRGSRLHSPAQVLVALIPAVMGIINVTPDSFYPTSRSETADAAIARGREFFDLGVDIVDVGGESSRPGAETVSVSEECARVLDVVRGARASGAGVDRHDQSRGGPGRRRGRRRCGERRVGHTR
jgi:GTP cyclohydrolase I